MKKFSLFLVMFSLFFCNGFTQQSWTQMIQDHNAKLSDVQNAFYTWYSANKPPKDSAEPGDNEEDGNYMLFKRWEWFMQARTYPTGLRPDPAVIQKEYQDFLNNKKSTHRALSTASWSYAGSSNVPTGGDAGRVNRVRFDPNNSSIMYACSPSGGLWKSTNSGASWTPLSDKLLGIGTSDIAIDPTNSNILYLATGDGDGILGGFTTPSTTGVMKSIDGGVTWQQTSLNYTLQSSGPSYMTVNQLIINPNNPQILLAAASFGLYYTNNGGITWNIAQGGSFKSVEFEPGNTNIVYATTSNADYYRSTTGGQTFTSIALPSSSGAGRMQLGVSPASPNYVYVLADNASTSAFFGIWLSTDTGKTFKLQTTTPNLLGFGNGTGTDATQGQGWYTLSIAVSPTNAASVLVGGVDVWSSTNSGTSWTKVSTWNGGGNYTHADIHHIIFLPGSGTTVFTGNDGGVSETTAINGKSTKWTDLGNGLEIAQQYSIGLSGSNANEWITGWQDNGTNLANAGWGEVIGGDGMMCFIDQTNSNYMYGETYNGGFEMSNNGGTTFNGITNGITETGAWVTPWMLDPSNHTTVFAGISNVWKSTNQGTSWSPISTFGTGTSTIVSIAVAPSNDQYIYAAEAGAMYATTNGGTNWNGVTGNLPVGSGSITNVYADPANPLRVWATMSGYAAGDKVYQSTTGGTTWVNISNGLPNLPTNCMVYQGSGIDAMYAGTDMGVYYRDTTTTGGDWVQYSNGLPNVEIADLKIYAASNILRAATYGRGTWQIATYTPATAAPVANFTAFPTTLCINSTVQFTDTSSNEPTAWSWKFTGGTPSTSTAQNPVVIYSTAGTYPVTEIVYNGIGQDSVTINSYITVNPLPVAPTIKQNNDTLFCTPTTYAYYQWYKSGTVIPGANTDRLTISVKGVYKVYVSDSSGCTVNGQLVVSVIGIDEISLNDFIAVYPNPTTGNLQINFDLPEEGDYSIAITNVLGQNVYSDKVHLSGQYVKNVNLSGNSSGVYFLSVTGPNSKGVKKILLY